MLEPRAVMADAHCCVVSHSESAAYHSLLESAVQLGHDQQAVLQNVYLMRENRLPPDMGVLLDLMGVTEDEVVKCE